MFPVFPHRQTHTSIKKEENRPLVDAGSRVSQEDEENKKKVKKKNVDLWKDMCSKINYTCS